MSGTGVRFFRGKFLPGHQALGSNFYQALRFGVFYEQHITFDFKKSKQRVAHSLKILISAL